MNDNLIARFNGEQTIEIVSCTQSMRFSDEIVEAPLRELTIHSALEDLDAIVDMIPEEGVEKLEIIEDGKIVFETGDYVLASANRTISRGAQNSVFLTFRRAL